MDIDLTKLAKKQEEPRQEYLPSTIWAINLMLSSGLGVPRRQIIEIFSPEGAGKSTLLYDFFSVAANYFKYPVLLMNQETPIDERRIEKFGLRKNENILVEHEQSIEHLFIRLDEFIENVRKQNKSIPIVIGIDSVNAIAPLVHVEKRDMLKHARQGGAAHAWADMLRGWMSKYYFEDVTLFLTNHLTDTMNMYGPKTTTPGGRFIKYIGSFRISMRRKESIEGPMGVLGHQVIMKCVKNKFAPPMNEIRVPLLYGADDNSPAGFWDALACLYYLQDRGVLKKSGSWSVLDVIDSYGEVITLKFQGERGFLTDTYPEHKNLIYDYMKQLSVVATGYKGP